MNNVFHLKIFFTSTYNLENQTFNIKFSRLFFEILSFTLIYILFIHPIAHNNKINLGVYSNHTLSLTENSVSQMCL